jgi:hypothetical protein
LAGVAMSFKNGAKNILLFTLALTGGSVVVGVAFFLGHLTTMFFEYIAEQKSIEKCFAQAVILGIEDPTMCGYQKYRWRIESKYIDIMDEHIEKQMMMRIDTE